MGYTVTARQWEHGWELHIDGIGVTQTRLLANAERMVRDYLALDGIADAQTATMTITPDLNGLEAAAAAARRNTEQAQTAQREAARTAREVVAALRHAGLSVADTATIMGFTKGRVSQLSTH